MINLKDKTIIITGGSGLIGSELINYISKCGANTINLDIVKKENVGKDFIQCDITRDEDIYSAIKIIKQKYSAIDGLVNNAYPRTDDWNTPFESITPDSWRKNINWQMNSYFVITQEIIKQMVIQSFGSIINIASIYGIVGNDFSLYENTGINPPAAYSAIKGGIINFTRFLASRYGKNGIRINCVSPGGIFNNQNSDFVDRYEKKVPLKRMGNPNDISPLVAFLLSDEANYITGQNLIVDGGWTII